MTGNLCQHGGCGIDLLCCVCEVASGPALPLLGIGESLCKIEIQTLTSRVWTPNAEFRERREKAPETG